MGLDFDLRTDWDGGGWDDVRPDHHSGSPIAGGNVPKLKPWVRPASTDWTALAACKGLPTSWWFPDSSGRGSANNVRARAICHECPVRDRCAEYGKKERWGIWGDLNRESRRKRR